MLDPKVAAETAQSIAAVSEMFPPMWWGLYKGNLDQGFTESQSLSLVKTFIMSMGNYGNGGDV